MTFRCAFKKSFIETLKGNFLYEFSLTNEIFTRKNKFTKALIEGIQTGSTEEDG